MAALRVSLGRILRWRLGAAALLLVALAALLMVFFTTESGTRYSLDKVLAAVPGAAVAQVEGTLWRGITLENLRYADGAGTAVALQRLELVFSWPALLKLRLHLPRIEATGVELQLPESHSAAEPGGPLDIEALGSKLPLAVQIDALILRDVAVQLGPEAAVIRLASLGTSLAADRQRAVITRLELALAAPVQGHLDAEASLDWQAPHAARLRLDGDLAVDAGRLDWSLAGDGNLDGLRTTGRFGWQGKDTPDAAIDLAVENSLTAARIEALTAELLDGSLTLNGEVGWEEGLAWRATLSAKGLQPGPWLEAATGPVSFELTSSGHMDPQGELTHDSRMVDGQAEMSGIALTDLRLHVTGDLKNIRFRDLAGRVLGARVAGEADLQLGQEEIGWTARLSLDEMDLSRLETLEIDSGGVHGRIGLDLSSRGQLRGGQPFLTALLENLRGEVEGQPLSGRIALVVEGDAVRLQPADLTLGASRVQLSGTVTPPFDLQYRLMLPDLARLPLAPAPGAPLAGRVEGEGRLRGTLAAPQVDATLSGRGLAYGDLRLAAMDLRASADGGRWLLEAGLKRLVAAGQQVAAATAKLTGSLDEHALALSARSDHGRLELALQGGLHERRWQGRLTRLDLLETRAGDWELVRPAALVLFEKELLLDEACLSSGPSRARASAGARKRTAPLDGQVCLSASRQKDQDLHVALRARLPLALARPVLPETLRLPGEMTLAAGARIGETIDGEVEVTLPDNRIIVRGLTVAPLAVDYRGARIRATLRDQRLQAQIGAQLSGHAVLDGEISAQLDGAQPLSGEINLQIPDLAGLNAFIPAVTDLTGRAEARLVLAGTRARPAPRGRVTVDNVSLNLPDTGVAYREGRLRLDIDAAQQLELEGTLAGVDSGRLQITGQGSLAKLPEWRIELAITGEDLPVLRTAELVVDASPALTVKADQEAAEIRGRVVLPRVEARVHTLPEGAVRESPDLVLVGQEERTAAGYRVRTDVEVVLGERVQLEGMGFSAGLAGRIRLRSSGGDPIAAFGEVDIKEGRYEAYGQDLRITRGRLTFNGPLDDPGLDVRASRTAGAYQTGLELTGTLGDPRSRVFSVPALSESDALSLLLTGRRLSEGASGDNATLLLNALAGLGVSRADDIAREIGQTVGFDELGLDTDDGLYGTQLTVGKRINSRLLVRYAVGLFDGVGRVITVYKINRYLDLEISSGPEAQGGDLIFRIER
ncbi:MAG: translocation/assembly module TamB domain-containing protein [Desulfobacteraceae bacterium]|jgi:translocation and assembly module TamB|nr:translocation/assembly module TamB domain-containing protein [Desulfobacteraceae bacterium]